MLTGGAAESLKQHDKFGLKSWKGTNLEIFARLRDAII